MSKVGVSVKLRPIKHAFVIRPDDKKSFQRAVELSSLMWGGQYNPIIPYYKKLSPKWAKHHSVFKKTSKDILKGYIDAYDPDFIVPLGDCKKEKYDWLNREVLNDEEIDKNTEKTGDISYGMSLFEVLHGFRENEIKFVRKHPVEFKGFSPKSKDRVFLGTVFGMLSDNVYKSFSKHWAKELDYEELELTEEDFFEPALKFNIRKLLNYTIEQRGNFGFHRGEAIFVLNTKKVDDLIDFWNLKALGWKVLPLPETALKSEHAKKAAKWFIEKTSGSNRHNNVYHHSNTIISKNVKEKNSRDFFSSLSLKDDPKSRGSRYVFSYYPRIWDEWARSKDGGNCCDLEAGVEKHDFNEFDSESDVRVSTVDPEFAERFTNGSGPRFANEVTTSLYGNDELYAEVIPEAKPHLTRTLSSIHLSEWRFTKRAASYLSSHTDWHMYVKVPKAEEVFKSWMKDEGYEINLSAPGRLGKQIIKLLGGKFSIGLLANEKLIELLRKMEPSNNSSEGNYMNKDEFWSYIHQIANSTSYYNSRPEELLERYIDKKMFQLGVELQCKTCSRRSWFDIESLKYNVQCKRCFEDFEVPTHSPTNIVWSYRSTGPFNLPGRADGVLPSLLTLRVFTHMMHHEQTTPMLSFETEIKNKKIEVDLGLFFREERYSSDEDAKLIFAECKSENSFKKEDVDKMALIAEEFPGSVLVFSTLKEDLSATEKRLLKPLVNRCRRYYRDEKPYNPVLILTKTELFYDFNIRHTWEEKGGDYEKHGERHYYDDQLLSLCDSTQQIYLGMEPWQSWVHNQFEKKRRKRKKKIIKKKP